MSAEDPFDVEALLEAPYKKQVSRNFVVLFAVALMLDLLLIFLLSEGCVFAQLHITSSWPCFRLAFCCKFL